MNINKFYVENHLTIEFSNDLNYQLLIDICKNNNADVYLFDNYKIDNTIKKEIITKQTNKFDDKGFISFIENNSLFLELKQYFNIIRNKHEIEPFRNNYNTIYFENHTNIENINDILNVANQINNNHLDMICFCSSGKNLINNKFKHYLTLRSKNYENLLKLKKYFSNFCLLNEEIECVVYDDNIFYDKEFSIKGKIL
jgi:hypothetical protein